MKTLGASIAAETFALAAVSPARAEHPFFEYDGTFEGFLTCIFEAFSRHVAPQAIACGNELQLPLFAVPERIETDPNHAFRVRRGISLKLGEDVYESVRRVYLSDGVDKGIIIHRYLVRLFKRGVGARTDHADPTVAAFESLERTVARELDKNKQFLRFSRLPEGIYVARITPRANVIPLMMDYFAARFNAQPFLIYDGVHGIAGVYDLRDWRLVVADDVDLPDEGDDEREYQRLWKRFYDAICNDERYNPGLRRQLMPKRYWGQLAEMNPLL